MPDFSSGYLESHAAVPTQVARAKMCYAQYMLRAILFDLDDTLLGNNMSVFLPPYLEMISEHAEPLVPKEQFRAATLAASRATMQNTDLSKTNAEVYWEQFEAITGCTREIAEPHFTSFYSQTFPILKDLTETVAGATDAIEQCSAWGLRLVLATNPIFPRVAILERLRWAQLSPASFQLITSYENMHSTKPHPSYYQEILQEIGCTAEESVMVGNSLEADIKPAAEVGLRTYWVTSGESDEAASETGPLGALPDWIEKLRAA